MKTNTTFFKLFLNTLAASALMISAQGAGYLKFDGIDGECKDRDHKGWSDLLSFSQAMHKSGEGATGATRRRGDVVMEDIVCVKVLDKSSPKIAEAVAQGKVFSSFSLAFTQGLNGDRHTYYSYELQNVLVTSYSVKIRVDEQGNDVAMEEFTLNFEKIKVTYNEVDEKGVKKGNVEYSWKVEEGEKAVAENPLVIIEAIRPEDQPTK